MQGWTISWSLQGFLWVLENLESPGVLLWHFPGEENPGKRLLVLESSGNLSNSSTKIWNVWQTVTRINIEISGVKWLMWILQSWKINLSPGKVLKKIPVSDFFFLERVQTLSFTYTGTALTRISLFNKESSVQVTYLISDFSQLKIAGNFSQKAGNPILGTLDLKISRGACPQTPPKEPLMLMMCPTIVNEILLRYCINMTTSSCIAKDRKKDL